MNPNIEKQVSELLELVKNGAEQLPPYLQTLAHQAVLSELISSTLILSASSAAILASFYAAKNFWAKHRKAPYNDWEILATLCIILGVLLGIPTAISLSGLLSCVFTPDLVAFKALRGLIQ
jgi:hypothetical protein